MAFDFSWMARVNTRCPTEPERPRRWRHIAIVALSPLLCSLSIAQLFLSVLLFTYLDIPQCLVVGQIVALIASVLCLGLQAYFWFLTHLFRTSRGLRTRNSYRQNLFMSLHLMFTSIWWISCLNGAYIFGFGKAKIGCPPSKISGEMSRVSSPCQVYQVSLSTSVPAFICSFIQLVLFVRCKRPFLSLRAIFRDGPSPSLPTTALSNSTITNNPRQFSYVDASPSNYLQPPPTTIAPNRPRSWLFPDLEEQLAAAKDLPEASDRSASPIESDVITSSDNLQNKSLHLLEASPAPSKLAISRSQSCASTLVDPISRCSSMYITRGSPLSATLDTAAMQTVRPALLAEKPSFAPVRWSMPVSSFFSCSSEKSGGEGT